MCVCYSLFMDIIFIYHFNCNIQNKVKVYIIWNNDKI